eukprot:m51a1_g12007 hypothetical protein (480) ;mRNA; f:924-7245
MNEGDQRKHAEKNETTVLKAAVPDFFGDQASVDPFIATIEAHRSILRWDDETATKMLCLHCKGGAAVFGQNHAEGQATFAKVISDLRNTFAPMDADATGWLAACVQAADVPVSLYAQNFLQRYRQHCKHAVSEEAAVAVFVNGIRDPRVQVFTRVAHATTLLEVFQYLQQYISEEVERMLKAGIIRESVSPWSAPVVIVPKKDGRLRFCVDYRALNTVTKSDVYPLLRIDEVLETMHGCSVFTTLDALSGYNQIGMDKEDREKTAFSTRDGHYEYNVLSFGLKNAPATFQRFMDLMLRGLTWERALVYIDDVILFSKSVEDHFALLEEVLAQFEKANLKLRLSKCHFFKDTVEFLGHQRTVRPYLDPIPIGAPFDRMHVDIAGPMRASSASGAKHFIVFVDAFTKWTVAEPLTSTSAVACARVFVDRVVCQLGTPKLLVSDRGANLAGNIMTEFLSNSNLPDTILRNPVANVGIVPNRG